MVNIGDVIYQLFMLVFMIGIIIAVFFLVRSFVTKQTNKSDHMEQKLDRIIELLEKDKKE